MDNEIEEVPAVPVPGDGNSITPSLVLPNVNQVEVKLGKKAIQLLHGQGSSRISFISKDTTKTKSKVWEKFQVICVDGILQDFVLCSSCKFILAYTSNSGTSALYRHDCEKLKQKSNSIIGSDRSPSQPLIEGFTNRKIPAETKRLLNDRLIVGLAKDLRPLNTVEGQGFIDVAQRLVEFGAKFGNKKISDIFHHRTYLKKRLPDLVCTGQEKVKAILTSSFSDPKLGLTMDMWSDNYKQRSFLSLTAHCVDSSFTLKSFLLGVDEFQDDRKSTENILINCKAILGRYFEEDHVNDIVASSYSVTDGGSNMIKVFPTRLPCQCHRLNLVIEWTIASKEKDNRATESNPKKAFRLSASCPKIKGSLIALKEVVSYFKRAGLNKKLKKTLKQEIPTRWNSQLTMLQSFLDVHEEVIEILVQQKKYEKVAAIDLEVVKGLLEYLTPFKECTDAFSADKSPTIHLVTLWYHKLRQHIKTRDTDNDEIKALKQQTKICMDEYCILEDIYYAATMLHPRYKSLRFADPQVRDRAKALLRTFIEDAKTRQLINPEANDPNGNRILTRNNSNSDSNGRTARPFDEFEDVIEDVPVPIPDELENYFSTNFQQQISLESEVDLLAFWRDAHKFPFLRKTAGWLLAIPASQASDERVFSLTGGILSPKRTELSGSTLSSLAFLNKNYDLFE